MLYQHLVFISKHRPPCTITIFIFPDHRPVIHPFHWLQMHHSSIGFFILEVKEPMLTCLFVSAHAPCVVRWQGFLPGSSPLFFHKDRIHFAAQHCLPASAYPACRGEDVVIAVAFIKLGASIVGSFSWPSYTSTPLLVTCVSFFVQFFNYYNWFIPARLPHRHVQNEIYFSIIIPKSGGQSILLPGPYYYRFTQGPRIFLVW